MQSMFVRCFRPTPSHHEQFGDCLFSRFKRDRWNLGLNMAVGFIDFPRTMRFGDGLIDLRFALMKRAAIGAVFA